jgi:hypothetical protein
MAIADSSQPGNGARVVCLYHGTDIASAEEIRDYGVDAGGAAAFNVSGEFWASINRTTADIFAQVNPAAGVPARLDFDLPEWILTILMPAHPPGVYRHGTEEFEFLPSSYPLLNQHMTNRRVVAPVP